MVARVPPGLPYHRLARTAAHRWWRPWLGLAFVAGCWVVLVVAAFGVAIIR